MSARFKRVLITGATGFVGSNIVKRFAEDSELVVAIDLNAPDAAVSEYVSASRERVQFIETNVADENWHRALPGGSYDVVVHAAAITNTADDEEITGARAAVEVNVLGSVNLLCWALEARPGRFVYLSSGAVYGRTEPAARRLDEETQAHPETVYALTKFAGERIALRIAERAGLPLVAARLPSQYGPMERNTKSRTRLSLLEAWCTAAVRGEEIIVNTNAFPRDYTYVGDVADAIFSLAVAPQLRHLLYNIGTGTASGPKEIVAAIRSVIPDARVRYIDEASVTESDRVPVSIERLHADTGWKPSHTLAAGVAAYIGWLRETLVPATRRG